ncbi:hypothetical protein [Kribbella shirazensis]|uniref:Putative membrane protein n=1 Tax=Kribbella shirazensis TaxID=1105143 RepID=A0A7X5VI33_9ACTN|nr:hypothetical protein [Kribbella shirazensis]NIK61645.1 putative membrane protein [Kribbella shirazensis]
MADPDRLPPPTRLRRPVLAIATAFAVLCGLLSAPPAVARPATATTTATVTAAATATAAFPAPVIERVTSAAGFVHPGLAVSASSLERARTQVQQGAAYRENRTTTTPQSQLLDVLLAVNGGDSNPTTRR